MKNLRRAAIFSCFILLFLLMMQTGLSWGPHTHTWLADQLFERQNSQIIRECLPYKDAFLAGSMMPDITVVYYFSKGGQKYRATHNWNFQQEVMAQARTPDEKAFAYGIACHLIADSVSHTMLIPSRIRSYGVPNWLIHPLTEKKYDSILASRYPDLKDETRHMLDAVLFGPKADRYLEMVENALGTNSNIDVKDLTNKLGYSLDAFYNKAYRPRGGGLFAFYPMIDSYTDWVNSFSSGESMSQVDFYAEKTLEECENVFNNWGGRYQLSPHGFDELRAADKEAANWFVFVLFFGVAIGIAIPPMMVIWRRQFRWFLLYVVEFFIFVFIISWIYLTI